MARPVACQACGAEWGDLCYCEECDTMYCWCGHDCDFNDLYDADELGLNPEDDDERKYFQQG